MRHRRRTARIPAAGLALLALLLGCGGGDGDTKPDPTAAQLTAEGWTAFEAGDLTTADARFQDALARDDGYADALTGRGWTALRRESYASAGTHFTAALAADAPALDAAAGRLLVEAALDHPQTVRDGGLALLAADAGYRFSHDDTFSASDVRWLTARAALDLGDYVTAAGQLAALTDEPVPEPGAAGFLEAALVLLEELQDQV